MTRKSTKLDDRKCQASLYNESPPEPALESDVTHSHSGASKTPNRPRGSSKKKAPEDYEVGFGKPPKAHRFKPGQSGNRLGRPKRLPELSDLIGKELKRKRNIVEDGHRVSVQVIEILVKRLIEMAAKGAFPALMRVLEQADSISAKERQLTTYQSGSGMIVDGMSAHEAAELYAKTIRGYRETS